MGKWTDDQLQYLREHSRSQPAAAIAAALGRTEGSVRQKRRSLGLQSYHAGWTKAEEQFLQDQWGVMSIPAIAKRLNRSVEAVIVRKNRLGLGPVLFGGDYISMNQLIIAVCGSNAGGNYKLKSWVENRGLPIHTKRVNQNSFRVIRLNEFWKWAEQHRAIEELSELQKELCKSLRSGADRPHIAEEIADVQIMLEEMMMLYECREDVSIWRRKKVNRLYERLVRDGGIGGDEHAAD